MNDEDLLPVTRLPRTGLPPRAIVVGDPFRAERIARRLTNSREVAHAREYRTFTGTWDDVPVVVASHGVGAPGAWCLFEELADAGVQTIIRLGTAGAMQPWVGAGDLVIAEAAVRDDGVSQQVIPPEFPAFAAPEVTLALQVCADARQAASHRGVVWTRAAFYPGFVPLPMSAYQRSGVLAIEMELAALLVLGATRRIACGGILVIDGLAADELVETTGYDPHRDVVDAGMARGIEVALDAVVRLAGSETI